MAKKNKQEVDISTEEKIKEAARQLFMQKGYSATRTRDIAEASGINLALLNYYFRSKDKLFDIIMLEKVQILFGTIAPILMNPATTLETKIDDLVEGYLNILIEHQDLPLFVLSELRNNPERFGSVVQPAKLIKESRFAKQLLERRPDIVPLQYMMSILGMVIFPFVGKPLFQKEDVIDQQTFQRMMEERKKLIPKWAKAMLKTK